jgi:protein-tyrosine phosphatase
LIDLHSHILPGIDDGAKNLEEAVELAKHSVENGVSRMVCTPHIHQGIFDNNFSSISSAFDLLVNELRKQNIPLQIAFGSEVRVTPDIINWVTEGTLPFIGEWEDKKALLLELPHSHIPPGIENLVRWLLKNGVQPIIPHPERNREIIADPARINTLKRIGCLFQVTAGAFIGRFNEHVQSLAETLLQEKLITYVASDMHSLKRRPNDMLACRNAIEVLTDTETANSLVFDVPSTITKNMSWQ